MPVQMTKRELDQVLRKSHKQQIENMPEGDVVKDMERRIKNLEREHISLKKQVKELLAHSRKVWKLYGEYQRRDALLEPDGGEEGF